MAAYRKNYKVKMTFVQSSVSWVRVHDLGRRKCFLFADVIYVSAAGSMLCQIINSLLLLPVSVARPVLSHLLDLLPPLDRLNRLLPAAAPLEDQELQWPLHGEHQRKQILGFHQTFAQ